MLLAAFKPSNSVIGWIKDYIIEIGDAQVENQIICVSNTCKTCLNNSRIFFVNC